MEGQHEIQLNKPKPFKPKKNSTSADWRIWKQNFLIYIELTEARLKLSKRGLALFLLNLIGPVGIEAKENMIFDDPNEEESVEVLLKKFDEIFDPPLNEIEERYKFFSRRKYDEETVQNYVSCLKEQAAKCNFNKHTEKFILDMVVLNMDDNLQQHIFLAKDVSLPMAIKLYEENLLKEEKMKNLYDSNFDKLHTDDLTDTKNDYFSQNINHQENKANNTKDRISTKDNASKNNCFQPNAIVCGICSETGHYSKECNNKVQNNCFQPNAIVCGICSETGHYSEECNNKVQKNCFQPNVIVCGICLETGHYLEDCNNKVQNNCFQPNAIVCGKCSETGHYSEECNKVQNNFDYQQSSKCRIDNKNQAKAVNVCRECGIHHQSNECPARKKQHNTRRVCYRCNSQHPPKKCPAYNVTCSNCNKLGHFDRACKSKQIQESSSNCPRCNVVPLQPYNELYDYCKYCKVCIVKEEVSDDSTSSESLQPRRRNRRQRRARNEEGCCIC